MILLNYTPTMQAPEFPSLYERTAQEGMVHSALMCGEHYDPAPSYNEDWACPAVTWSSGGREVYDFDARRRIEIAPVGVLTIAAGERYAYRASSDVRFRSNMISFPRWITSAARRNALPDDLCHETRLATRLRKPSAPVYRLMSAIAGQCAGGTADDHWYEEHIALLYQRLLDEQSLPSGNLDAAKPATRKELVRRADRGAQFMLEHFRKADLTIDDIAGAACLSRFHLIRVFKAIFGATPMQYLTAVRMDAAARLLRDQDAPVAVIAERVGYTDRSAFVRRFTRQFGTPPSSMRSRMR